MWSIPGTEPALFFPGAFTQFIEGAIATLPASTQQTVKEYLMLQPKHQTDTLLYHRINVTRAIVVVWQAQSFGDVLKPEMISQLHLLDNPEGNIKWDHFGIPIPVEVFIRVIHTASMRNAGQHNVNRADIHKGVLELSILDPCFSQAALLFNRVWNLVDPNRKDQTDSDGLYFILYLIASANEGGLLPMVLPESYRLFMLSQRNHILGQLSVFITTPQRAEPSGAKPHIKITPVNLTPDKRTPVVDLTK
ncbi:hypothetical protein M422DRAFT_48480 [Sphaerobolus stellatus SS14]|uniref:EH domain-containing protein n=1 Tax=Sphaerobolus stellatus (strain SS14) TaxID=990650 RepID=A0A0C9VU91_SPHS4|nr:hypothetical protein M422DRAFT_48480 [Sphaerobolus stellatus SS14]